MIKHWRSLKAHCGDFISRNKFGQRRSHLQLLRALVNRLHILSHICAVAE